MRPGWLPPNNDPNREGWVYYALSANAWEQRIKIGFSVNVRLRRHGLTLDGISVARQVPITIGVEPGIMKLEHERHEQFADLRVTGEWFRYEQPLVDHIRTLSEADLAKAMGTGRTRQLLPSEEYEPIVYLPGVEYDF